MNIKLIKNEDDYNKALKRVDVIIDAEEGSAEMDELEILGILIQEYEKEHFQIMPPSPIEAILFRMEQMGYTINDLAQVLGQRSRVSEILKGTRKLSLSMIRALHEKWNIPTDILIMPY